MWLACEREKNILCRTLAKIAEKIKVMELGFMPTTIYITPEKTSLKRLGRASVERYSLAVKDSGTLHVLMDGLI